MSSNTETAEKRSEGIAKISAEELQKRLYGRSSTDDDERKKCPHCGSVSIAPRQPQKPDASGRGSPGKYYCYAEDCGEYFDKPEVPRR